jgi:hypothetical protein
MPEAPLRPTIKRFSRADEELREDVAMSAGMLLNA